MFRRLRQVLQENNNFNVSECDHPEECNNQPPIKLKSSGFKRENDGSVTLSVTLDKDQVECCVCFSSMTGTIYRCRGQGNVCHNICATCEWQIRRMKNGNGHTKIPTCPICKAEGQFIRNRPLEKQLHEISIPCKNNEHGCEMRYFGWDENSQQIHSKKCMFEPVTCPFCFQSVPGGRMNFIEHLRMASPKNDSNRNKHESKNNSNNNENSTTDRTDENNQSRDYNMSRTSRFFGRRLNNRDNQRSFRNMLLCQGANQTNPISSNQNSSIGDVNDEEKSDSNNLENQNIHNNQKSNVSGNHHSKIRECCLEFKEAQLSIDVQKYATFTLTRDNVFVANYAFGYVLVFLKPNEVCPCWKVYCISIAPHHGVAGNNRVYLQYQSQEDNLQYLQMEQQQGLSADALLRPVCNTLQLSMGRLAPEFFYHKKKVIQMDESHNHSTIFQFNSTRNLRNNALSINGNEQKCHETDESSSACNINNNGRRKVLPSRNVNKVYDNDNGSQNESGMSQDSTSDSDELDLHEINPCPFVAKSPCTPLQVGYIYAGTENMPYSFKSMQMRLFALEESIKVGTIIDARDFTGKWYQAEVLKVADSSLQESSLLQDSDPLITRRCKIHYLGYSANYDEWLNIDTDSHRIAQRGIYTVGPDLRAARRYTGRPVQVPVNQSVFPRILVENADVANNGLADDNNDEMNA